MERKIVTAGDRVYLKFFDLDFFHEKAKQAGAKLYPFKGFDDDEFKKAISDTDALVLIDRQLRKDHIDVMDRCRIILALEVGYDFIDIEAATGRGIIVSNVPTYCTNDVAVHTFTLLLSTYRKLKNLLKETSEGGWNYNAGKPLYDVKGKVLGIIGLGRIGRALVPKAKGFDMEIAAYDPYLSDDIFGLMGVKRKYELDELLSESDIISLHVPLTPETFHMIGENEFALMKKDAIILNTCRGKVIDEKTLYKAVKNKIIAGAGLDVLEKEPPDGDNPILNCENVVVTPHTAWYTEDSIERLKNLGMDEVVRVLNGKRARYILNPEVISNEPVLQ
jgi:D-3-phosphoglycerate dehydrogenase